MSNKEQEFDDALRSKLSDHIVEPTRDLMPGILNEIQGAGASGTFSFGRYWLIALISIGLISFVSDRIWSEGSEQSSPIEAHSAEIIPDATDNKHGLIENEVKNEVSKNKYNDSPDLNETAESNDVKESNAEAILNSAAESNTTVESNSSPESNKVTALNAKAESISVAETNGETASSIRVESSELAGNVGNHPSNIDANFSDKKKLNLLPNPNNLNEISENSTGEDLIAAKVDFSAKELGDVSSSDSIENATGAEISLSTVMQSDNLLEKDADNNKQKDSRLSAEETVEQQEPQQTIETDNSVHITKVEKDGGVEANESALPSVVAQLSDSSVVAPIGDFTPKIRKWSVDILAGPSYNYRLLNIESNTDLEQHKNEFETGLTTYSFSAQFRRQINRDIAISIGAMYLKMGERYDFTSSVATHKATNEYNYYSIPLIIDYRFLTRKKMMFSAGVGAQLNFLEKGTSSWLDPHSHDAQTHTNEGESSPFSEETFAWNANLGLRYKLSDRMDLLIKEQGVLFNNSIYKKETGVDQREYSFNTFVGLGFKF